METGRIIWCLQESMCLLMTEILLKQAKVLRKERWRLMTFSVSKGQVLFRNIWSMKFNKYIDCKVCG